MDTLIRPDNPEDDTGEQQVIRQVAEIPPRIGDAGPVDLIDLELALAKMKSGKAPGPDNINPELIKKGWTPASDTQSSQEYGREDGSSISSNRGTGRRPTQDLIDLFACSL